MALKGKWALKWVMLSVPILVKLEFFQHPREDVIEVVVCTTAVIIISVQFSELEYCQTFYLMLALYLAFFGVKSVNVCQDHIHLFK